MKRAALILLAATSFAATAHGHAVDFTARPESYAAQPRQTPVFVVPLYSGRSIYTADPPFRYRCLGPLRPIRSICR